MNDCLLIYLTMCMVGYMSFVCFTDSYCCYYFSCICIWFSKSSSKHTVTVNHCHHHHCHSHHRWRYCLVFYVRIKKKKKKQIQKWPQILVWMRYQVDKDYNTFRLNWEDILFSIYLTNCKYPLFPLLSWCIPHTGCGTNYYCKAKRVLLSFFFFSDIQTILLILENICCILFTSWEIIKTLQFVTKLLLWLIQFFKSLILLKQFLYYRTMKA